MDIQPQYEHGKYGTFMFNLCARWTKFLVKHRWLYYLLACTWGSILTVLGWILTLVFAILKIFIKSIKFGKFNWVYYVNVGPDWWGGLEMGLMFMIDKCEGILLYRHEFGHTFQNCLFGPLTPILVTIPSAIRYWYQTIREWHGKSNKDYDSIWFEDSATQCGTYVDCYLNNKEE